MPSPERSRIIVLHLTKYSDHGLVLHAIDSTEGRRSFLVRGIKRGNAVAVFHPLSVLDVVSAVSPKSTMGHLREWKPVLPLHGIRSDLVKGSLAMFLSEVLYRSLTSELADPQLFDWLCGTIAEMDAAEGSVANYPLWFLSSYAVRMGFMPGETIEPSGIFSAEEAALFQRVLHATYDEAMAFPLSGTRRQAFSRKLLQYLSWHLGVTIEAKSLDVLHEVLA